MIPESALSIGYGTRISSPRVCPVGGVLMFEAPVNCQMPLRLCQSARVSCGRGYSGRGLVVLTWPVHGVVIGGVLGTNAAAGPVVATSVPAVAVKAAAAMASSLRGCAFTFSLLLRVSRAGMHTY
jgi:hypothetical protein